MSPASSRDPVSEIVDHLFRREAGRLTAILAGRLGTAHLQLAEDVVQDALLRAMQTWPFNGVPENPSAWLLQTARNRAFDTLRRDRVLAGKTTALAALIAETADAALAAPPPQFEDEIADRQLRMMFVCCAPALPVDAQVALVLKTLCGFGEREIAAAFLTSEAAIARKLVRARKLLRDARLTPEPPPASRLAPRVGSVLAALYLLFNEGYKASHGDSLLRADLCAEALRLGELLAAHPVGDRPATHALLALQYLHAARLPARMTDDGSLLVLAAQDRSKWDRACIGRGLAHLGQSAAGERLSRYHLEAGIAAVHALAPDFARTDWPRILELYDDLLALEASPVIALNRTVVLARLEGAAAGLRALDRLPRRRLANYHLFDAVRGQLLHEAGDVTGAREAFACAHRLATLPAERDFLAAKLAGA